MQQKWRTKTNQLCWKLVATNVPWLATFKTSYQTSAEELLWSEWDYRQSIKGQGLISHSKWALRSFYCEHHSHTYLSTLTNMHTHSLRGSKDSHRRIQTQTTDLPIGRRATAATLNRAAENRNISVKYRFHYLNSYLFYSSSNGKEQRNKIR